MFAFHRSALAVLVPLALLVGVVVFSSRPVPTPSTQTHTEAAPQDHNVAANLPSR